jgi:acyl-CoA thioesterase I
MSPNSKTALGCLAGTAAATLLLAVTLPAHAQAPAAMQPVAPATTPAAMTGPGPAATPAVMTKPALSPADPAAAAPAIACSAPSEFTRLDRPLRHTARRLISGEPLTIVAIGSSSTAGAGASSPAASYPSRLEIELKTYFPEYRITVLNRGVNGEETNDMMARFADGVIAAHPQLILWQVGTNSVLRDRPLKPHSMELHEGIDELKATGADVVLIDPQYAPKVLAKSETSDMIDQIALAAKEESVDLFHRFAVMRDWHEVQHLAFSDFLSPDSLHMNDWGYACWAKLLATGIAEAATRPMAAAAAQSSR